MWNHKKWTYFVTDFPRLEPLCAALLALAHILFSAMLLPLRFDGLSHETCYFFSSKNVSSCAKHTRSCLKLKVVLGIHMRLYYVKECVEEIGTFNELIRSNYESRNPVFTNFFHLYFFLTPQNWKTNYLLVQKTTLAKNEISFSTQKCWWKQDS